jgi:hypothetical protein
METVVVKNSRWQYAILLLASLGFVAGGAFILAMGGPLPVGWAGIVFFGACALVSAWQFADARPRLSISERGILDRTMGIGLIPWSEIERAYVRSIAGNDFICLVLRNPETYTQYVSPLRRAMSSANRALGFTDFSINLSGVNARIDEVFELVIKHAEAAKRDSIT